MHIQKNIELKSFNTLNLSSVAKEYILIHEPAEVQQAVHYAKAQNLHPMVLSGGSNLMLPEQIDALVMHMDIAGIEQLHEDEHTATIRVGAGQNWHEFVLWTTAHQLYGLQNLVLIPGKVGASPVQNIGAYGVEAGEFIEYVEVYDIQDDQFTRISQADCHFSYRHSIFKEQPERYVITHVVFKLLKHAELKISYGDLKTAMGDDLTPENLQQQVMKIRQSKLPDPAEYPNVGSFFKNPVIDPKTVLQLFEKHPDIPQYPQPNNHVKLAAGWLIDRAGWKGKRLNKVGMFEKQALVLVNYQDATLKDVQATYHQVQADVFEHFGIRLEPEPVLIDQHGRINAH